MPIQDLLDLLNSHCMTDLTAAADMAPGVENVWKLSENHSMFAATLFRDNVMVLNWRSQDLSFTTDTRPDRISVNAADNEIRFDVDEDRYCVDLGTLGIEQVTP